MSPPKMHKYRIHIVIERIDEKGTEDADVHIGVVHATEITPLVSLANQLTKTFGALDEKAKA